MSYSHKHQDQYLINNLPILFIGSKNNYADPEQRMDHSLELLTEISEKLTTEGFVVQKLDRYIDYFDLSSHQHFCAFLFHLPAVPHSNQNKQEEYELLDQIVGAIRYYDKEVPLFLYGKEKGYNSLSEDVVRHTTGFIYYGEDTVEFNARYISREARYYLKTCLPPFFRHLMEYVYNGSYSWHCPGHSGGTAFLKSPVGKIFHQFFGENLLRADVCNAVESLGQLLEHTGQIGESERSAAHTFCADNLYFVTNGTSTSNKIVAQAHISPGDLVLVDRNCHQSILHAIIQTSAIPIFLQPSRNTHGIAGPIPEEQFEVASIQAAIAANPLVPSSYSGEQLRPKAMIITQSTYDGVLYNAESIKAKLDGFITVLHFDEAWIPHAVFHDFYFAMHAMGKYRNALEYSTVYSTQSTHKLLAGLSQASQILVQNASKTPIDPAPLEAAYLMHTSTSPQYSILASLDVSSAMMSGSHGYAIVEEALLEALSFRSALRQYGAKLQNTWWFLDWGPEQFSTEDPNPEWLGYSSSSPGYDMAMNIWQKEWWLEPENPWHGFTHTRSRDFNMLDPIKTTLHTPGLSSDGELLDWGIPAVVVGRYLEENGIIVEKTGLYSLFVMFTIGITKGRWKGLLSALQRFKVDYDDKQSLWQSMPKLCQQHAQYAGLSLYELCEKIHSAYRSSGIHEHMQAAYATPLVPRMTPAQAYQSFVQGAYESVPINEVCGRVSASMVSVYPPGIPLVFPGEVIPEGVQRYLLCIEELQRSFPGFGVHIHGVKQIQKEARHKEQSFLVNVVAQ